MTPVHLLEFLLLLLLATVVLALVARHLRIPPAAAFTLGGIALALAPGTPRLELDPALTMTLFLPPLLQSSAFFTNWRLFRANLRPIFLLAVGCVLFTTVAVAVVTKHLAPELPWGACFVLGAIISPPDAVAASAVLQRLSLPRRLVAVLEGESLVNDATGLVLYRVALAATLSGTFSLAGAAGSFVLVAVGGIAVGIATGQAVVWVSRRINDTHIEIALSFLLAWGTYIAAELLGVSGVLATVACGLVLGWRQHEVFSPQTRLEARATWTFAVFLMEALVFILIGLSLNGVLARLGAEQAVALLPMAALITLAVVGARIAWVYPGTYLPRVVPSIRRRDPMPPAGAVAVVAWAGMRGVVSLAAALAVPEGFPGRDAIVFVTFAVIVATVLMQGTTLGPLIQWLGVSTGKYQDGDAEAKARAAMAAAQLHVLRERSQDPLDGAIARDVMKDYEDRAAWAGATRKGGPMLAELRSRLALRLEAAAAARTALMGLHRSHAVPDSVLHALEHELDLEEIRVRQRLNPLR